MLIATAVGVAIAAGSLVTGEVASATPTPAPTSTATPTARPTGRPTATPSPTPTPSATPTPTATVPPRPVGSALDIAVTGSPVLTLPAKDGLRDSTAVRIRSGAAGTVDVLATRGTKTVHVADGVRLVRRGSGWQRSVAAGVQGMRAGSWVLRVRRSDDHSTRAVAPIRLVVGSGKPEHVSIAPTARTLYPWQDGVLDRADVIVTGTDETGATVPLRGTVRIDAGRLRRTAALSGTGAVRMSVSGLPLGAALVTATVTGPAGPAAVRTTPLTLDPTGVGTLTLSRSSDTLQPVVDGLLDSLSLTTGGAASVGSPATVSGTLTIARGRSVVQRWLVPDGTQRTYTWDGRVAGAIVPGTYTATLTLAGPEGMTRTRTRTVLVTKDHLPYVVQDLFSVAAGNQQGLAVRDGVFYVGYASADGATATIDRYASDGNPVLPSLSGLPVGHIAEISYSTTTGLLYAANGGAANPTTVWALKPDWDAATIANPASAIVDTVDLSALGNNGMVAVDDAHNRLLVFAGTAPDFTVTPVSLTDWQDPATGSVVPKYTRAASMPITIAGVPQGVEDVGTQLWLYTSLRGRNHIAKYDLPGATSLTTAVGGDMDLIWPGEGEGFAVGSRDGQPAFFVGAHDDNRIGVLVPVASE